jgi:hypothetical protein
VGRHVGEATPSHPTQTAGVVIAAAVLDRRVEPLFWPEESSPPERASMLDVRSVDPQVVRPLIAAWHSRLPSTQKGPWIVAYVAAFKGTAFGAALWHNPSARGLPQDWLELRRLAIPDDAPHCTASRMLGQMRRDIRRRFPDCTHLISYQDESVHTGGIYRAAGWTPEFRTEQRQRDRSSLRPGGRLYRWSQNGEAPDVAAKVRWGIDP